MPHVKEPTPGGEIQGGTLETRHFIYKELDYLAKIDICLSNQSGISF